MSKLEGRWGVDNSGRDCYIISKKRGRINDLEVFEFMEKDYMLRGKSLIHMVDCPDDEVPVELYEEGDKWFLYEPEVIIQEIAIRASDNTGYNYKITKE